MRRKDREITDELQIDGIIRRCHCCRLGFNDNGEVYIVPLNFGFVKNDGRRYFYFHGANAGRKYDLMLGGCNVGFELDCGYELHTADSPCGYSAAFSSVIGTGHAVIITDPEEKAAGLRALMKQAAGMESCEFTPEELASVCIFRLEIAKISCKVHL